MVILAFKSLVDQKYDVDEYGNDVRKECNPELRDNEWIRAEALEKAKNERKGYIEIGGRQGWESTF